MALYRNWATGQVADINPQAGAAIPAGMVPWDKAASDRDDKLRAGQGDPNKPLYPTLDSWINDAGRNPSLKESLLYSPSKSAGYGGIKEIATAAPGTSAWEQMMRGRQGLEESGARDALSRNSAAQRAMGFSDIARRGGISRSGMRSVGRQGLSDYLMGNQDLRRQGMGARADIGLQGEQQRVGALGQLAGMDESAGKYNITNLLTQKRLEDAAKLGKYSEEMRAWAANKQADATANSGKK